MAVSKLNSFNKSFRKDNDKNICLEGLRTCLCDGKIKKSRMTVLGMESYRKCEVKSLERGVTSTKSALLWLNYRFSSSVLPGLLIILCTPQHQYQPLFALDRQLNISNWKVYSYGTAVSDFHSTNDQMKVRLVVD